MTARPPLLVLAAFFALLPAAAGAKECTLPDGTVYDCGDDGKKPPSSILNKDGTGLNHGQGTRTPASTTATDAAKKVGHSSTGGAGVGNTLVEGAVDVHLQQGRSGGGIGSGLGLGMSLTLGKIAESPDGTVPTPAYVHEVRTFIQSLPPFQRSVAELVDRRITPVIQAKYPEAVPAANLHDFRVLLTNELAEKGAIRALRRRQPPLSREQFAAEQLRIETESNARLEGQLRGSDVKESFATKFTEAWEEFKSNRPDRGEYGHGGPNRARLDEMLRTNPRSPDNWALDAQDKLAGGDAAGGRAALDKAIALGGSPAAFALRGGMRLDGKDYDGAYQDAKQALALSPGDKDAMGLLKSAEGRVSPGMRASTPFGTGSGGTAGTGSSGGANENRAGGFPGFDPGRTREIPGMTPASTLSSSQKLDEARRAMSMGDVPAAIAMAKRALELNPNNAAAHGFLSGVYARSGDYKNAIASADAGLALAPRDAALLNSKAFAENRSKQYRAALGSSNNAIQADARNPYSYANRAHAYGGLGDKESMMSDINRAAGIDPRFEKAAADAAALQLPSNADILFMFPGENPDPETAAPAAARSRSAGLVVAAALLGGLLLAAGLLSTVLAPLRDSAVSAFTKATRRGPSVHALEEEATPETLAAPAGPVLIRGQYEISRQIGAGGMGMVYEGTDRSLGRRVAIKKMREELRINPRERERFVIEAKTVASLHHPNIVDIYAIAEEGDDVYLVFEHVDGRTIHELVQAKGRLSPSDSLRVTQAIAVALSYAHSRGVIHRDMKPSNVMLTSDAQIKVMDFGIARMAKDALTRYSMTNSVVGTPPYMAPEQEQGVVRKESDVYALAVCSYEMMTGKLPFVGIGAGMLMNKINMSYIPPSRAIAGLPETLDEVFLTAFQADPDQRYRTPQDFAAALEAALGGARSSAQTA